MLYLVRPEERSEQILEEEIVILVSRTVDGR